ncbi:hypothetical protein V500_10001 [Pseudogymnoascus sp. VKM F-4518 (FW-2643)]|nr:hypothetical protein V500_10001 [Pseudogymnoascus sp. VKM F-4518 (FW-2643)]
MAANKKGKPEDPLARYMPQQSHSESDIAMAKDAQLPARNESFERELDDSLKQALLLGRRYTKREKEIYTKQGNEAHAKQGKERHARRGKESYVKRKNEDSGDIYDIPISDDTEGVDNE